MDNQQWQVAKKVAATYIGTVVGAGFATGREIVEFFTVNGFYGTIGICISGFFYLARHKDDVTFITNRGILSSRIQQIFIWGCIWKCRKHITITRIIWCNERYVIRSRCSI